MENDTHQTPEPPMQDAQADIKKVAEKAKAASAGFSFENLFKGRIDNMNYLYAAIASFVVGLVLMMVPLVGMLVSLALGVLGIGLTIRRLHDIGQTGWFALICLIPYVGILMVIYLCWKMGVPSANAYGAAPDPKREFFRAVLNT